MVARVRWRPIPPLLLAGLAACSSVLGFEDGVFDPALDADASVPSDGSPDDARSDAAVDAASDVSSLTDTTPSTDGGPSLATFTPPTVDFGGVACGTAPPPRNLRIDNRGGAPLVFSASLSSPKPFSIVGATSGTIAPNQFATLVLASDAVNESTAAGTVAQAVLTIATNDPTLPTATLPVLSTAAGATVVILPDTASFGEVPVATTSSPLTLSLSNSGNRDVSVTVLAPADPQFAGTWTDAGAFLLRANGAGGGDAGTTTVSATFTPTTATSTSSFSFVQTPTGAALCGASTRIVSLRGAGSSGAITVQPGALDFGFVNCGSAAPAQTITVANSSTANVVINGATFAKGSASPYTVSPNVNVSPVTLLAKSSVTLTVTPASVPSVATITPDFFGDSLTITTNAVGDVSRTVDLHESARGAVLTSSASSVDFGATNVGETSTRQITISNTGNAPATLAYATNGKGFAVIPASQQLQGAASSDVTLSFAPTAGVAYTDTASIAIDPSTVLCAALPSSIALQGTGTTTAAMMLSTTNINFDLVACGGNAPAQTVTLTNTATSPMTWSTALGHTSPAPYYDVSPSTGTLAAGASVAIDVTPRAIPATSPTSADLYGDTLTFSSNTGETKAVGLHETAQGAILAFNPTAVVFGDVPLKKIVIKSLDIQNTGNVAATVALLVSGTSFSAPPPSSGTVAVNGSVTKSIQFAPIKVQTYSGLAFLFLQNAATTPLCAPQPTATLSGTGQ